MDSRYIYIITRDELVRLDCSKVVYMVGDGNYTDIVLVNKQKHSICMNLSRMQQLVSESLREQASFFVRIGKRFIVNLSFVYKVQPLQKKPRADWWCKLRFQVGHIQGGAQAVESLAPYACNEFDGREGACQVE